MEITQKIRDTTYIIAHDDYMNSAYKNGWINFRNFINQYDILLDDITKYENKFLIVDFYKKAFNKCAYMKQLTKDFNLTNKEANEIVKKNINDIVEYYVERIQCGIKQV
jgi:hypothetical protein